MTPILLYGLTVLGAVGLFLMLPKQQTNAVMLGGLLAAAALGGLWLAMAGTLGENLGIDPNAFTFHYIFSGIAIVAAVKVITHTRPVYAALWFVLVVLASAGLFLTLAAEFMAFAMVIIYGGAILVTYMFVIMLADQSQGGTQTAAATQSSAVYDRYAAEPLRATVAGFLLLAVLLSVTSMGDLQPNPTAAMPDEYLARFLEPRHTDAATLLEQQRGDTPDGVPRARTLTSGERVGMDLFMSHPLGLELAGVILLVALIGAVTIARKRVYEEDQVIIEQEQAADQG